MTLPAPVLDDRTFQDIVDECKRMIPRYTPEWTDHNVSDPGVTFIELFAWMTELLLYRINQVPRRNYIKFLEMIGVRLEPARPARAEVMFRLSAPQPETVLIPAGTEVATQRTATREAIIFATEQALEIAVPSLLHALVSRDELTYGDYLPALRNADLLIPIFAEPPRPGNGFYLGYEGNLAAHTLVMTIECQAEGIGVDPRNPPLAWEYYDGSLQTWRRMPVEEDTTGGLNRTGQIIFHIPATSRPRELDRRRATWVRCRIVDTVGTQRPYFSSPRVLAVRTQSLGGSVMAHHSEVVNAEVLGRSNGRPGQTFSLNRTPILPRRPTEVLEVETETPGSFEPWIEVAGVGESLPGDAHFTLDSVTGQLQLGPSLRLPTGQERQYGQIPRQGRMLRFTHYRTGGGILGNVGKETLVQLKTSIPYVAWVSNPLPAVGGTEAESLEMALLRGPEVVRGSPRAVTAADYERLALEASPDVARAFCQYAGETQGVRAGSVRVVLIPKMPTTEGVVPPEQLALSDRLRTGVQTYLDERRMITVRLYLEAPVYVAVAVSAEVYARPRADRAEVREVAEKALYRFLHPTVGGHEGMGWPFERSLFISDLYSVLQAVPAVEHVGTIRLAVVDDGVETAVPGGTVNVPPRGVLCSAEHTVEVR